MLGHWTGQRLSCDCDNEEGGGGRLRTQVFRNAHSIIRTAGGLLRNDHPELHGGSRTFRVEDKTSCHGDTRNGGSVWLCHMRAWGITSTAWSVTSPITKVVWQTWNRYESTGRRHTLSCICLVILKTIQLDLGWMHHQYILTVVTKSFKNKSLTTGRLSDFRSNKDNFQIIHISIHNTKWIHSITTLNTHHFTLVFPASSSFVFCLTE